MQEPSPSPPRNPGIAGIARRLVHARRRAGSLLIASTAASAAKIVEISGLFAPDRHGLQVERGLAYTERDDLLCLDVYRPRDATHAPALIYAHGGGFTSLSKETHQALAVAFAKMGFVVFNIDYRLAPAHRFPAAIEDAAAAYCWVVAHGAEHGADVTRLVLAGESAGGNLVTGLALAACFERPEPFAKQVYATAIVPRCVLPSCGLLDVADPEALLAESPLPLFVQDRVRLVSESYLGSAWDRSDPTLDFARPLVMLERNERPQRPLPRFHIAGGSRDPVFPHSRRLAENLRQRATPHLFQVYPGGHAFNAFVWGRAAKDYWRDAEDFLRRNLN